MNTEIWARLLSPVRLGDWKARNIISDDGRSEFDRDYDRIVFSSAFRRMQDKTQVFPFSTSDYTRTRLTHTMEVATVGRTLGRRAGSFLIDKGRLDPTAISPSDVGTIVASACLAHDTGNPPFGHSGESAIQYWAAKKFEQKESPLVAEIIDEAQRQDFLDFEGNAQSFRIFSKLQAREKVGGLQLTLATFGALVKYPCSSKNDGFVYTGESIKKFGYFQDDARLAQRGFDELGLIKRSPEVYARHPLAFLMEAADDICNRIIDLEDACRLHVISIDEVIDHLLPIARLHKKDVEINTKSELSTTLGILRATAMSALVSQCMEVFEANVENIEAGRFDASLISQAEDYSLYRRMLDLEKEKIFVDRRVLEIEYAGFQAISGLLEMYQDAIFNGSADKKANKLLSLFPIGYLQLTPESRNSKQEYLKDMTSYQKLLVITDYVAGMTDSFALDQYQKLSGIKMPR